MELSTDTKKLTQMLEQTQQAMHKLANPLSALAAVQLAGEFYTKDERVELLEQYKGLEVAVQKARDVHNAGLEAGGDSGTRLANHTAVLQAQKIKDAFSEQHVLIAAMCNARLAFQK